MAQIVYLTVIGFLAGTLGGLVGIGGGVILMPVLRFGFNISPLFATGTSLIGTLATALSGSSTHYRQTKTPLTPLIPVILSGTLSSLVSSYYFKTLAQRENIFDTLMGTIMFLIAFKILLDGFKKVTTKKKTSPLSLFKKIYNSPHSQLMLKIFIGIIGGGIPAFFGLGAGVFLVPSFIYLLNMSPKKAMGASLICFLPNVIISSIYKFSQNLILFDLATPIFIGAFMGSYVGAKINNKISPRFLKVIFGLVCIMVSLKFFL